MAEIIFAHKQEGRWHASALAAYMKALPDGQYSISIARKTGRKSTEQNAYLHVLFSIIADTLNAEGMGGGQPWTKERIKDWCKAQGCYPVREMILKNMPVQVAIPTRELNKEEAMLTIERVLQYWAELGIILPSPNQQLEI